MGEHDSLPRILVAGIGPLPPEAPDKLFAPGLRVWGIASELAKAGHPVRLVVWNFGKTEAGARCYDMVTGTAELPPPVEVEAGRPLPQQFAEQAKLFRADALIGCTDLINFALASCGAPLPLWLDYFGDPLAERQMLARAHGHDGGIAEQYAMYIPALARADVASGCGAEQAAAIYGELGGLGRLNQFTADGAIVQTLKPWWTEFNNLPVPAGLIFRGNSGCDKGWPLDAHVAIQSGGFNTWLDVETLFAALEIAMAAVPNFHFACTGGAIAGHHTHSFDRFSSLVERSAFRERYHLLGWQPLAAIPSLFAEANLGLNIDLPCPEGRLGTRNRLLDWVMAGLPVVTTPGCPLAEELALLGAAQLVPHGDANAIGEALAGRAATKHARLANDVVLRVRHACQPDVCLRPLLEWARAPRRAPDLHAWENGLAEPPPLWLAARQADKAESERRRLLAAERRLHELEGSRWVRLALKLRGHKAPH